MLYTAQIYILAAWCPQQCFILLKSTKFENTLKTEKDIDPFLDQIENTEKPEIWQKPKKYLACEASCHISHNIQNIGELLFDMKMAPPKPKTSYKLQNYIVTLKDCWGLFGVSPLCDGKMASTSTASKLRSNSHTTEHKVGGRSPRCDCLYIEDETRGYMEKHGKLNLHRFLASYNPCHSSNIIPLQNLSLKQPKLASFKPNKPFFIRTFTRLTHHFVSAPDRPHNKNTPNDQYTTICPRPHTFQ